MLTENLNDLRAFVSVARERSFTRAAAQLGMSRSALSHAMTSLEARLGIRLLTRTTRSVATTAAGARLLATLTPMLLELDAELASLRSMSGKPAGHVRITATDHVIGTLLWPRLREVVASHPDLHIELSVDYQLTDIVSQGFDAGVRTGDIVDKDMIATRIGPDFRMAVVAAPAYLAGRTPPREPNDLTHHQCINLRLATLGGIYAWDFERDGRSIAVRVGGQTTFNNSFLMQQAALDGHGFAYLPEPLVAPAIKAGQLIPVLEDWWQPIPGFHLYYTSRRQIAPALALVIDALKYHG
ncbi:LysR family transcriptional regulator [Frateuria aurantia]